jgi:hypothetical protein
MGIPICQVCLNAAGGCDAIDTSSGCHPGGAGCYTVSIYG